MNSTGKETGALPPPYRDEDTGHNNPSRPPSSARAYKPSPDESPDGFHSMDPGLTIRLDSLRRALRRWIWILLGAFSFACLIFYLLILDFLVRLQHLPTALQAPAWLLAGGAAAFVFWAVFRLLRFWLTLQSFRRVSVISPFQLAEDPGEDLARWDNARETLSKYLKALTERRETQEHWDRIWPPKSELRPSEVLHAANRLLESRPMDSLAWARELETRVLNPIDAAARSRIRHYAQRAGIKTAISPFPLVDSLAVLYNASLLIQDLASLYGRRLGRAETGILLALVLFQVYVAGEAQELTESGLSEVQTMIGDGMTGLTNRITSFLSPKVAEGVLNGYILYRLGHYAQNQFRPLKKP